MESFNVYVEELTSHIPARLIPVTDAITIDEAIVALDEMDSTYYDDNGKLKVSADWHKAAVLDFKDWLSCHVPDFDDVLFSYRHQNLRFVRKMLEYTASELSSNYLDSVRAAMGEPTQHEMAQAQVIADTLCSMGNPITVSFFAEGFEDDNIFYVPKLSIPFGVNEMNKLDSIGGVDGLNADEKEAWTYFTTIAMACIMCLRSSVGSLTYIIHDEDTGVEMLGLFLFCKGHITVLDSEDLSTLIEVRLSDNPNVDDVFMNNITSMVCRTEFEFLAQKCAGNIAAAIQDALEIAFQHVTGCNVQDPDVTSCDVSMSIVDGGPLLLIENALGDYAGISGPELNEDKGLAQLFEEALERSPFVTEKEATMFVVASAISDAGSELLFTGSIDESGNKVFDFVQELDFGLASCEVDIDKMGIFEEYSNMVEDQMELAASDEIFEALDDDKKAEISHIINMFTLEKNKTHSIVSLEGDLEEEEGEIKATRLSLPPEDTSSIPKAVADDFQRMLRSVVMKAASSPMTTLICASKIPMSHEVDVSGITWRNGSWTDVGEEKMMFYLTSTNIGNTIELDSGDDIDYRYLN